MEDRRKMRRFTLRKSCLIYTLDDNDNKMQCQAVTSNVSTGGAFVDTQHPFPIGTPIRFELLLQWFGSMLSSGSCVSLNGWVNRTDSFGMALSFGAEYQIVRIPQVAETGKSGAKDLSPIVA